MEEQANAFDDLGSGFDPEEAKRQQKENEAKGAHLDELIHRVFEQNDAGRELLAKWEDVLLMVPTAQGGMDHVEIGIREGYKLFIRGIILTIQRVERGEK